MLLAVSQDPLPHQEKLDKALAYLKSKMSSLDAGIMPYMGLAFLLDGREEFKEPLQTIVDQTLPLTGESKHFNGNWHLAQAILFLSEVYKRDPSERIAEALKQASKSAARSVEATGGWCHHRGYAARSGYDRKGGGVDISMLTALMVAALMNMRAAELEVNGSLISNGVSNLKGMSRGGLIGYGTGNGAPDRAAARGAMLAFALWLGKQSGDPHVGAVKQILPRVLGQTESGHAWGPLNFLAVGLAGYATGQYGSFASTWLGRLRQAADGTVTLRADGRNDNNFDGGHVGDTAVYAILILLQRKNILEAGGGSGAARRPSISPFSQRK
jgi:hypothetical protein